VTVPDQLAARDRLRLEHEHAGRGVEKLQQDQARPDPDDVAVAQLGADRALAVDEGAVAAVEIVELEYPRVVGRLDPGVPPRDAGVAQGQGRAGLGVAPDHERFAAERSRVPNIRGGRAVDHEQAVQPAGGDVAQRGGLCLGEGHARGRSESN
jgi:hypothetical protein